MTIRPMTDRDMPVVLALVQQLHPTWPAREREWYEHALVAERDGEVIGYSVWGYTDGHAYGKDHGVRPDWQRKGIGHLLHQARLEACQKHGAVMWVGLCWEGNEPMVKVLEAAGAKRMTTHPGYFPDGADATTYVQRLNGG